MTISFIALRNSSATTPRIEAVWQICSGNGTSGSGGTGRWDGEAYEGWADGTVPNSTTGKGASSGDSDVNRSCFFIYDNTANTTEVVLIPANNLDAGADYQIIFDMVVVMVMKK